MYRSDMEEPEPEDAASKLKTRLNIEVGFIFDKIGWIALGLVVALTIFLFS